MHCVKMVLGARRRPVGSNGDSVRQTRGSAERPGPGWRWLQGWVAGLLSLTSSTVRAADGEGASVDLNLGALRQLVLDHNESILMRAVEVEIAGRTEAGERGIFEPQLVTSVDYTDTDRPNNAQQRANLGFFTTGVLAEKNTVYNAGLEFLSPVGTRLRLGYTLRELENNLQFRSAGTNQSFYGPEYESFAGVSLVQPLLKNFGLRSTMAKIRLAALASEVAYHGYRRQLMLTLAQAESTYWELYLAQERARIGEESVRLSERIRDDNRARLEVGKGSEIDVLQAQAGAALRRTRLNEHQQRVIELAARLSSLYGSTPQRRSETPRAVEEPVTPEDARTRDEDVQQAFEANPDYRMRQAQLAQEGIRVQYTKNQRLPQLDLKASYGLNGLGLTPGQSIDDIENRNFPAWSVGMELRVPLGGGIKERNDHRAAQLAKERALLGLREVETQIQNGIESARRRLRLYSDDIEQYRAVVDFQARLLQSQLDRLAVGAVDSRVVLETEEKLSETKAAAIESLVFLRRAAIELELVRGTLLQARHVDFSRDELRQRTRTQLQQARVPDESLAEAERRAARAVDKAARQAGDRSR